MISKTTENLKINKEHEKLYLQSVRNFNQFTEVYNKYIEYYSEKLQFNWIKLKNL
jgi:NADPH-dependent 7-cyano-7-deazaguanine reductase QueF